MNTKVWNQPRVSGRQEVYQPTMNDHTSQQLNAEGKVGSQRTVDHNETSTEQPSAVPKDNARIPATDAHGQIRVPNGVPDRLWQKFQDLKTKRKHISELGSQKRIKRIQEDVLKKVSAEFHTEEDRAILRENDVALPGSSKKTVVTEESEGDDDRGASTSDGQGKAWEGVRQYLTVNDHLNPAYRGNYGPKTELEDKIDEAITLGDYDVAEKLSDHMANREFGRKIVEAIDAKRFLEKQKHEDDMLRAKKKKKLAWGFGHKARWETKSNM